MTTFWSAKSNASARYATDAKTSGLVEKLCIDNKIPYQKFVALTGMPTVDIGVPQLSMHSARELIASKDQAAMCKLLRALYN